MRDWVTILPLTPLLLNDHNLIFEHLEHLVLLLLLLAFLQHSHRGPRMIRYYSWLSLFDLLKVLLDVQLLHLLLKEVFVALCGLFGKGTLATLLCLFLIHTVLVLFLSLHDAFLSLLLFCLIVGALFEFLQFLAEALGLMFHHMKSCVGVIKVTGLTQSGDISCDSYEGFGV